VNRTALPRTGRQNIGGITFVTPMPGEGYAAAQLRGVREDRAALRPCETCRNGCDCDGSSGDTSCGHYACWGRAAEDAPRCPGVAYEKARRRVLDAPRAQEQIHAARRRGPDVLARVITQLLTAAGLPVTTPAQVA
jgi:hypothetical protein